MNLLLFGWLCFNNHLICRNCVIIAAAGIIRINISIRSSIIISIIRIIFI